jgi:hypothetical protein
MTQITVQAGTLEMDGIGGDPALEMRIFAKYTFTPSTGEAVIGSGVRRGRFFKPVACTVAGGVISYPEFQIDSTTDAIDDPRGTTYAIALFTTAGVFLKTVYKNLRVDDAPAEQSLAQIVAFSAAPAVDLPDTYYTAEQINALLANLGGIGGGGADETAPSVPTGLTGEYLGEGGVDDEAPTVPTGLSGEAASDVTAPSVPAGLAQDTVTDTTVSIDWSASTDPAASYGVTLDWSASTDPPVSGDGGSTVSLDWSASTDTEGTGGSGVVDGGDADGAEA